MLAKQTHIYTHESRPVTIRGSQRITNFGDLNTINKAASSLFYSDYGRFLNASIIGFTYDGNYIEKSVRTVYEALEKDFYALENELIAMTPT